MTASHESSVNHNSQPLSEELQARFDALLRTSAEQLEIFTSPDEITLETKQASFGNFGDGSITISHTIDHGFHSGAISFTHPDNIADSFLIRNAIADGVVWRAGDRRYSSRKALQVLHRNWPIADSQQLDAITARVRSDEDVEPQYIFEALENYTIRHDTGNHEYEMRWDYHDATHNVDTKDTRIETAIFTIICDGQDSLRQIQADIVIPYVVNNAETALTCHVHSNELGDVVVTATYINPETLKSELVPIHNPEGVYGELEAILSKMISEKTEAIA